MTEQLQPPTVAVAGLGNMGGAIARGLARGGLGPELLVHSRRPAAAELMAAELGARAVRVELLAEAATLFCCSEPDAVVELLDEIAPLLDSEHVVVLIAPSAPVTDIGALTGAQVARVIPNLGSGSGAGVLPVDFGGLNPAASRRLESVIGRLGRLEPVDETTIRAASGLASSGPAVVAAFLNVWLTACGPGLDGAARLRLTAPTLEAVAALINGGMTLDQIITGVALPGAPTRRLVDAVSRSGLREHLAGAAAANNAASGETRQRWLDALAAVAANKPPADA